MLFAHIVVSFTSLSHETINPDRIHPGEDGKKALKTASTYESGTRLKMKRVGDDGWALCEDGIGTFWAPKGTFILGKDDSVYILPGGMAIKVVNKKNGGYLIEIYPPEGSLDSPFVPSII